MNSQVFTITGNDFAAAFKADQARLKLEREKRLRDLQVAVDAERHAFLSEYAETYECAAGEGAGEADSIELSGQVTAERLNWLYENVIANSNAKLRNAHDRAAYLESALESVTEAMDDREAANLLTSVCHLEWFRVNDVDVDAYGKARTAAIMAEARARKGVA